MIKSKSMLNKKGFTLIELIIVIAIIAILAAVLIPSITNAVGKANESQAMTKAGNLVTELTTAKVNHESGLCGCGDTSNFLTIDTTGFASSCNCSKFSTELGTVTYIKDAPDQGGTALADTEINVIWKNGESKPSNVIMGKYNYDVKKNTIVDFTKASD